MTLRHSRVLENSEYSSFDLEDLMRYLILDGVSQVATLSQLETLYTISFSKPVRNHHGSR